MKFFAFIMALIVLVLSIMPCSDVIGGDAKQHNYEISKAHQQNIPLEDDCSPLCACSCCASCSVNYQTATVPGINSLYKKVNSILRIGAVVSVANPVWQPPKL